MAEQLTENNEVMSEEYTGSVYRNTPFCDPCKDDDNMVRADGFCVDCNDYLCAECYRAHRRSRATKHHTLQDRTNMPVSKPDGGGMVETCADHTGEPILWYCKTHDRCICNTCKLADHRNCTEVKSTVEISQSYFTSDELKKATDTLDELQKGYEVKLNAIRENTAAVERYFQEAIESFTKSITALRNKDIETMKALEVTCETTVKKISSLNSDIEKGRQNQSENQTFIAVTKARSHLSSLAERLASVENDNQITGYRYVTEPEGKVSGVIGRLLSFPNEKPVLTDQIDIKTSTDKDCRIRGMHKLSDNRLVIADRNNSKIKLVDLVSQTVTTELKLDRRPWDLTLKDDNEIVVTTWNSKKLVFVSVTDTLTVLKTVDKDDFSYCQGIVCCNNSLVVSYNEPDQIQILDMEGTVKRVIEDKDSSDTVRFGNVYYLIAGPGSNTLYLSDSTSHAVSSMTLDGQVTAQFKHNDLRYPRGISVGGDGRIFVCSYSTHKIFEISADLSEGKVVLDQKDGIDKPHTVLYSEEDSKLFVGSVGKNILQVFLV